MSHSAKKSRHRSPCTARSMTRLALGPLILTGLFLVGSVCADPVRAEEIDLASQPGFRECPAYTLLYQFSPKDTGQSKVK